MFNFSKIFISLFGIGFIQIAPGTLGTIFSIFFFYILLNFFSILTLTIFFFILFLLSLKLISIYTFNKDIIDAPEIVIDEFLGIFLIVIFYDYIKLSNDIFTFLLIFILFRFFDIIKIYPANWIDKNLKKFVDYWPVVV